MVLRRIPSAGLLNTREAALWLALATGCRIGELLRAEWQHVHLELLRRGDDNVVALKRRNKSAEPLTA